jgi:hypothetical protein
VLAFAGWKAGGGLGRIAGDAGYPAIPGAASAGAYRLAVDSGDVDPAATKPTGFSLRAAYGNPFRSTEHGVASLRLLLARRIIHAEFVLAPARGRGALDIGDPIPETLWVGPGRKRSPMVGLDFELLALAASLPAHHVDGEIGMAFIVDHWFAGRGAGGGERGKEGRKHCVKRKTRGGAHIRSPC